MENDNDFFGQWVTISIFISLGGLVMFFVSAIIIAFITVINLEINHLWLFGISGLGLVLFVLPLVVLAYLFPSKILDLGKFAKLTTSIFLLFFIIGLPLINFVAITFLGNSLELLGIKEHFLEEVNNNFTLKVYWSLAVYAFLVVLGFITRLLRKLIIKPKKDIDDIKVNHVS